MPNGGMDFLTELQEIIEKDTGQINEQVFRRMMLTSMLSVMKQLKCLNDNPAIWVGDVITKHPKVSLTIFILLVVVFTWADLRTVVMALLGLDPSVMQSISPTAIPTVAIP